MAISEEIKKRIYSVLSDGKVHYTEEIRKKCVDDGILKEDEVGKIRGVVYYLKKRDSRIKSEGRGKYRLVDDVQDNTMTMMIYKMQLRLLKIVWTNGEVLIGYDVQKIS